MISGHSDIMVKWNQCVSSWNFQPINPGLTVSYATLTSVTRALKKKWTGDKSWLKLFFGCIEHWTSICAFPEILQSRQCKIFQFTFLWKYSMERFLFCCARFSRHSLSFPRAIYLISSYKLKLSGSPWPLKDPSVGRYANMQISNGGRIDDHNHCSFSSQPCIFSSHNMCSAGKIWHYWTMAVLDHSEHLLEKYVQEELTFIWKLSHFCVKKESFFETENIFVIKEIFSERRLRGSVEE